MERRRAVQLLGGALSAPLATSSEALAELLTFGARVRASVPADQAPSDLLTPTRARALEAMAEIVIPRTDTPGAEAAGVTEFVTALVDGWLDDAEREPFLAGLDDVDVQAVDRFGAVFAECSDEERSIMIAEFDDDLTRRRSEGRASGHFFHDVKRFTLTAYFTSEAGLAALGHRIAVRRFEGCAPLSNPEGCP